MRRFSLLAGVVVWTVACVVYSYFFGGTIVPSTSEWGNPRVVKTLWSVSIPLYILVLGIWYGLNWINMVNEWERRPVMRFGRYIRTAGPGLVLIEPLIHTVLDDVPVQDVVVEVPVEHIQTMDNVGVSLTGLLTYRIDESKVKDVVVEVEDFDDAIMQRGFSTLTDEVGKKDLDHLLSERDNFCENIKKILESRVSAWGAKIQAFELKSFQITDPDIANAIAMKAKAQKEGEAEITRAGMQEKVAAALNKAAATYDDNGKWLKGIETLVELCRSAQNNTILIPQDLAGSLANMLPKVVK